MSTDAPPVCMSRRTFLIAGAGGAAVTLVVPDRSAFGQSGVSAIELVSYPVTFKGNGPAAIGLNPKPADWTSLRVQDQSDGDLFWKVSAGRGAMPSSKQLPEQERWALVRFIRTLKR